MKSLCIIIPSLNEQDSISFCLEKIKSVLEKEHIEKMTKALDIVWSKLSLPRKNTKKILNN